MSPASCRRFSTGLMLAAVAANVLLTASHGVATATPLAQAAEFTVVGDGFAFHPSRIVVNAGDAVTIRFIAKDRPYTFTIDAYRISRRAAPGKDAVIEFCADQRGTFTFYCSLTDDEGCRTMTGQLRVQ